jgi:hypothetical protein
MYILHSWHQSFSKTRSSARQGSKGLGRFRAIWDPIMLSLQTAAVRHSRAQLQPRAAAVSILFQKLAR